MIQINFIYNSTLPTFALSMKSMILSAALFFMLGCQNQKTSVLEPEQFNAKLTAGNAQLVDVRTPQEFDEAHLINAVNIDIKDQSFEDNTKALYKDAPVFLYCRKGARSADAAKRLSALGFKEIYELKGGINAWNELGLPVTVKRVETEKVDFKTSINGDKLVLVDFNATWCGPCKMMQPFIDNMALNRLDDVTVISVDTDKEENLAREYGIQNLPTIMLFKKGKILEKSIGYLDEAALNALVDKHK